MSAVYDLLLRVKNAGAKLAVKPDGLTLRATNLPDNLLAEIRANKAAILELLKATLPKPMSRRAMADAALLEAIPDVATRQRITRLAFAESALWCRIWDVPGDTGWLETFYLSTIESELRDQGFLIACDYNASELVTAWRLIPYTRPAPPAGAAGRPAGKRGDR